MNDSPTLGDPFTVPTRHWHRLDDGRVQFDVSPAVLHPRSPPWPGRAATSRRLGPSREGAKTAQMTSLSMRTPRT